jgi:hypothetical protein
MDNIIITHPDGSQMPLTSKQNISAIIKAEQTVTLLDDDLVTISVVSATILPFFIGDTIEVYGKTYTLNQLPTIKKTGTRRFDYELMFEGLQYELLDAQFLLPDNTVGDSFTGTLFSFLQMIVSNANRVFPEKWVVGEYPDETEYKTLSFTGGDNCLAVLQRLCTEYEQEFEIAQKDGIRTLHIRTAGVDFPYTFLYGRVGGMYELTRQNISGNNIVTRLYVYGGSSNIQNSYLTNRSSSRLCLPGKNKNTSYIENAAAVAAFGVKENRKTFDDIFPNRYGEVTAEAGTHNAFVDSTMNFDLNEKDASGNTKWLIAGVNAKVHFNTGNLAGYEFDMHKYDHATKTIEIVPFTDENGMVFPSKTSAAFQLAKGDKYFFIDINLPDAYVDEAESKLSQAGEEYYAKNSQPQVEYGLTIDDNFTSRFEGKLTVVNLFRVGDYIPIKDEDVGVDKSVRITGLTRDMLRPYRYSIQLADAVTKSGYVRLMLDKRNKDRIVAINNLANPAKARRSWRASQEVLSMVFDPEGDYYSEKIKPLSIETTMLQVGAKSMQFVLQNVVFEPNYQSNPNYMRVSGGNLIHYTIEEAIRSWTLATVEFSGLVSSAAYYIYARCQKVGDAGSIILDTAQRKVDHEAGYYTFTVGVLNSVQEDDDGERPARLISLTYGGSAINGRFVKTGRIQSADGETYFDLDNSEIGGKIKFVAANGAYKNVSETDANATEAKNYVNNTLPGILSEMQAQLDGQIEQFFYDYDPTASNVPAGNWTSDDDKESHLGDLFYNTSSGKVWRWIKSGNAYAWQELKDTELVEALELANEALALSKNKNRIFTATPTTPYDVGDLWVQGASGGIYKCKTARLTGSYSSSDWDVAAKYTDDTAVSTFINGAYSTKISELVSQIDGKIETWFQEPDPSTNWTTEAKAKHVGDMWFNTAENKLKRYSSDYSWVDITDQNAIDAYSIASQAKDTADGKRRVFVATPTTPYDVGDLWVDGEHLRRCFNARNSNESYGISDWKLAVSYDNTVTTINGGIVTSGTVQLAGSDTTIKAGITGEGTTDDSVRIWAGAGLFQRETAPFRVMQDGSLVASKAKIKGEIEATSGKIGNVEVTGDGDLMIHGDVSDVIITNKSTQSLNFDTRPFNSTNNAAVNWSETIPPSNIQQTFIYSHTLTTEQPSTAGIYKLNIYCVVLVATIANNGTGLVRDSEWVEVNLYSYAGILKTTIATIEINKMVLQWSGAQEMAAGDFIKIEIVVKISQYGDCAGGSIRPHIQSTKTPSEGDGLYLSGAKQQQLCYLCPDGIVISYDSSNKFLITNNGERISIKADLPTHDRDATRGELCKKSDGTVMIQG